MAKAIVFFILWAIWSVPALANLTLQAINPNTASNVELVLGQVPNIYGGVGGDPCSGSQNSTCNNCPGLTTVNDLRICNQTRIHDNLNLSLTLLTTNAASANGSLAANLVTANLNNLPSTELIGPGSTQLVFPGAPIVANIRWSELCRQIPSTAPGSPFCNETNPGGRANLRIGIIPFGGTGESYVESITVNIIIQPMLSPAERFHQDCADLAVINGPSFDTQQGICRFSVAPGDEKVFIQDNLFAPNESGGGVRNTLLTRHNSVGFRSLNVFGVELGANSPFCDPNAILPGNLSAAMGTFDFAQSLRSKNIIQFNSAQNAFTLATSEVGNLSNEICYGFFIASEDLAGNMGFFTPATFLDRYGAIRDLNPITAKPSLVEGILGEEDVRCFVATAAFGGEAAWEVKWLRRFRDSVLLKVPFGRVLVQAYYEHSPPLASWIASSEPRRFAAAVCLRAGLVLIFCLFVWAFVTVVWRLTRALYRGAFRLGPMALVVLALLGCSQFGSRKEPLQNRPKEGQPFVESGRVRTENSEGEVSSKPHLFADRGLESVSKTGEYRYKRESFHASRDTSVLPSVDSVGAAGTYKFQNDVSSVLKPEDSVFKNPSDPSKGSSVSSIEKTGTYIFKRDMDPVSASYSLQFGAGTPPQLQRVSPLGQSIRFQDIYPGQTGLSLGVQRQQYFIGQSAFWHFGVGLNMFSGRGLFRATGEPATETVQFLAVPIEIGVGTRFLFSKTQIFTPYVSIGGGVTGILESRSDNPSRNRATYTPSVTAIGGLAFNFKRINEAQIYKLNSEYNWKNLWLTLELRRAQAFEANLDVSTTSLLVGAVIDI